MFDSTRPPAQVPLQALTHNAPAKTRSIRDGRISVFHTEDALFDNIKHLAVKRGLEPISHMSGKFLLQMDRFFANRSIEADRLPDRVWRCFRSANYFD